MKKISGIISDVQTNLPSREQLYFWREEKFTHTFTQLKEILEREPQLPIQTDSGWLAKNHPPGENVTPLFERYIEEVRDGNFESLPESATQYVYLIVGGLFTKSYPMYMYLNLAFMKDVMKLDVRKSNIDTGLGCETNAEVVCSDIMKIAKEGKQVVVIGHSKGGVDAADAIAKYNLYEHVHAFIAMQAPYAGTPIVDLMYSSKKIQRVSEMAIEHILRANLIAMQDISYESRMKVVKEYPIDAKKVRIVSFTTECGENDPLSFMGNYIKKRCGLPSDGGVVPIDSQIPGAEYVHYVGLDHGGSVFASLHKEAPMPGDIMFGLIVVALKYDRGTGGHMKQKNELNKEKMKKEVKKLFKKVKDIKEHMTEKDIE